MSTNTLNTRIILRNDSTTNWLANETQVLLKGEVGIEFLANGKVKMKIGDGKTQWKSLAYFGGDEGHVFEATVSTGASHTDAITSVVGTTSISKGDVAIVKEEIIDASNPDLKSKLDSGAISQKYQYTAYVFNGTSWVAMDGNYNAENVYFDEDFTFTTKIGTVQTLTNGSTTVAAAGKNLKEFFAGLFAKEVAGGKKTDPSVSVTLTGSGDYEVGTTVTPSYSATFYDGEYTYGPEPTGVTVSSWEVTSTDGEEWSSKDGNCKSFTVADGENYKVTAKANHTDGDYAKSNIGNIGTYKFTAGSKQATSSAITGYRKQFYGAQVTPIDITSDKIRTLNSCKPGNTFTGKYGSGNGFSITIPDGCKQVVIALYGKTLKNVFDNGAFGTDILGSFVEVSATNSVPVEGANDYASVNYNVYVYSPDAALGSNTYDCVIG